MCNSAEVADLEALLDDLTAEGQELDDAVSGISAEQWSASTPAEGWTIAVQIAHLCWTDTVAIQASSDPGAFSAYLDDLLTNTPPDRLSYLVDDAAFELARAPRVDLMERWRAGRGNLVEALRAVPNHESPRALVRPADERRRRWRRRG